MFRQFFQMDFVTKHAVDVRCKMAEKVRILRERETERDRG